MAMRLQEIHPALVHYPLALVPTAVVADLVGTLTGSEGLLDLGRRVMPIAAASAAVAAVAGLAAQEEVKAEGVAGEMLVTHRNLNLALGAVVAGMAIWRQKVDRPSAGYLALGLAGMGVMAYTAYLGGHMVYEHGVGISAADGVRPEVPEVTPRTVKQAARSFVRDVERAIPATVDDIRRGELAPSLTKRRAPSNEPRDEPLIDDGGGLP